MPSSQPAGCITQSGSNRCNLEACSANSECQSGICSTRSGTCVTPQSWKIYVILAVCLIILIASCVLVKKKAFQGSQPKPKKRQPGQRSVVCSCNCGSISMHSSHSENMYLQEALRSTFNTTSIHDNNQYYLQNLETSVILEQSEASTSSFLEFEHDLN